MNCDNCVCCGSKNIEKVGVNTRVELIYPDVRRLGAVTQRVIRDHPKYCVNLRYGVE